ncbi:DUF5719 family protein [Aquipuribacter nitratireducens]|uniref:DUF5719 family protein n=1 Tax=Aquipuribacter nitratireducens TaxID=650104 RepID=A0ABW0GK63_9MICO
MSLLGVGVDDAGGPAGAHPGAPAPHVTAVLVVHDGAPWLPRALAALAGSTRRPDVVVAVDAGSRDRSAALLDTALLDSPVVPGSPVVDAVVQAPREAALGDSVARGLAAAADLPGGRPGHGVAGGPAWVWLLHDDCAPEPDALEQLLSAVTAGPTIAVAGCKQRGWDDAHRLVEAGATVTPGGRRLTDVAPGDLDQGQLDGRGDVLVVSTAGMLVRADVLADLGGLDPGLPLVGDDVDLCVRVRRAGHRVSVVPSAVVRHAAALETGAREATALRGRLGRGVGAPAPRAGGPRGGLAAARRAHWLHTRAVQAPLLLVPLLLLWVVVAAPARAVFWLLRRDPGAAWAELAALLHLLAHLHRVVRSRWRSRRTRAVPASALRPLRPTRLQVLRDEVDAWRVRRALARRQPEPDDEPPLGALETGPVADEYIHLDLGAGGPLKGVVRHPLTYLVPLVALVAALPAVRSLLRPLPDDPAGAGAGPQIGAGGATAGELWGRALSDWREVGAGTAAPADPATTVWAALTSVVSLLQGDGWDASSVGSARAWVAVAAPLVALCGAYLAAHLVVRRPWPAGALALTWALLPVTGLLGTVDAGTLVGHALLPFLALALVGCLGTRPVRSAGAAALLATVVVALEPAAWPALVLGAAVVGGLGGWRRRAGWRAALPPVVSLWPAAVLAPWAVLLPAAPRLLLVDPRAADPSLLPLPTLTDVAPAGRRLVEAALAGEVQVAEVPLPDAAAVVALVVLGAAVLAAAVLALLGVARGRVPAAWAALLVGAAALLTGALAVWRAGAVPSVPTSAAALAGLLVVALLVRDLDDPDRRPARLDALARRSAWRTRRLLLPLVPVGALVAAGVTAAAGALPPLPSPLPAAALVASASELSTRTLVVEATGDDGGGNPDTAAGDAQDATGLPPEVRWSVTRGPAGPGQASVPSLLLESPQRAGDAELDRTVATLLGEQEAGSAGADGAGAVAAELAAAGVGWVVVSGPPALDTAVAQRGGLVRTAVEPGRTTWRVDGAAVRDAGGTEPARARVVPAAGGSAAALPLDGLRADLPAGEEGRLLVLADNAHPGWAATLDGAVLTPTRADGWAQAFELPATGGVLRLRPPTVRPDAELLALAAAAVALLALVWPGRAAVPWPWRGRRTTRTTLGLRRRVLVRSGRLAAGGAALVVVTALAVATTGVLAGQVRVRTAAAAAATDAGTGAAGADRLLERAVAPLAPVVTALQDLRVAAPDPASTAPLLGLARAGAEQACPDGTTPPPAFPVDAARGLEASVVRDGDDRGLSVTACPLSATTSWLLLGSTGVGERPEVRVTGTGETAAVVDLAVGSVDGPVDTPAATGVLVPPGETTSLRVDAVAPDLPVVLVRVTARDGTVAVTGSDTGLAGLVPLGRARAAAQTAPDRTAVLPAVVVPAGPDAVSRVLLAPAGDEAAVTQVVVTGDDGPVDIGEAAVTVAPGGGVAVVDLAGLEPGRYTVGVRADVPVVAAATWQQRRDGEPLEGLTGVPSDRALVQATTPVGPAGTSLGVAGLRDAGALGLSVVDVAAAPGEPVAGRVELLDGSGRVLAETVFDAATGRPVSVPVADLLASADDAAADGAAPAQERAAVLRVLPTGDVPLHVGLRSTVDDPDGALVAATTVPGAPPAPVVVRLVREAVPGLLP